MIFIEKAGTKELALTLAGWLTATVFVAYFIYRGLDTGAVMEWSRSGSSDHVFEVEQNAKAYWTQMALWMAAGLVTAGFAFVSTMKLLQRVFGGDD